MQLQRVARWLNKQIVRLIHSHLATRLCPDKSMVCLFVPLDVCSCAPPTCDGVDGRVLQRLSHTALHLFWPATRNNTQLPTAGPPNSAWGDVADGEINPLQVQLGINE